MHARRVPVVSRVIAYVAALVLAVVGGGVMALPALAAGGAEVYVNLSSGDDAGGDGSAEAPYETIAKAQTALGTTGGTVHVKGERTGITTSVQVNANIALVVDEDTSFSGTATPVVKLAKGATVQTAAGASLTVTNTVGTNKALQVDAGATVSDGTYQVNGTFTENGTISGTSKQALQINVRGAFVPAAGVSLSRATIAVNDPNKDPETGKNKDALNFCPTAEGIAFTSTGMNVSINNCRTSITNSTVSIADSRTPDSLGATIAVNSYGVVNVVNSVITLDGGRLSLQGSAVWTFTDSHLIVQNSTAGALHVNHSTSDKSSVTFDNSTITTRNVSYFAPTMGVGSPFRYNADGAALTFTGDSVVNTEATGTDAIGQQNGGKLVVLGGSYQVNPANTTTESANPTNGSSHGNETLTYFTLADPKVESLDVIDKNSESYTYPVAQASDDGNKYVWVPAAKVTYKLLEASAAFADGSKGTNGTRTLKAMRGQTLTAAKAVNGTPQAAEGTPKAANGKTFAGWKYNDVNGVPTDFDPETTKVTGDITVYATWSGEATSAVVNYVADANGAQATTLTAPDKDKVTVASYEDVLRQNPQFVKEGYHFDHWSTDPEGKQAVKAGDPLEITDGQTPTLYANWAINTYTVHFSANGGTFSETSPFKAADTKDKFKITRDARGGEVATLKEQIPSNTDVSSVFREAGADPKNAEGAAQRSFFTLKHIEECDTWCQRAPSIFPPDTYYWFLDDGARTRVDTWDDITADVTYYLAWDLNDGVNKVEQHNIPLQAGLALDVTKGKLAASEPALVESGATLTATGSLNVKPIQDQIEAIGKQLAPDGNESGIELQGVTSGFTATLTLPEGITVDGSPKATLTDNKLFTITGATASGSTVTVNLGLTRAYTDFLSLKKAVLAVPTTLDVAVDNLTVTGKADPGSVKDLTAKGTVTGSFSGIATRNGGDVTRPLSGGGGATSVPAGNLAAGVARLAAASTGSTTYYFDLGWTSNEASDTVRLTEPQPLSVNGELDANITLTHGQSTEDTKVTLVNASDQVTWNGELDTQAIKDQITAISQAYCQIAGKDPATVASGECHAALAGIHLKDVDSSFRATLTLPAAVTPKAVADVKFTQNNLFEVPEGGITVEGQTVTVTMSLINPTQYDSMQKLYDAVTAAPATFTVSAPAVLDQAPAGTYTGVGEVTGTFKGLAYKDDGVGTRQYDIRWTSRQRAGGKDAGTGADDKRVTGTLLVPTPVRAQNVPLPADLLIATAGSQQTDTQHDAVRMVGRGTDYVYDVTGQLAVTAIKNQIRLLAQQYCQDVESQACAGRYAAISLDQVASRFVATLTLRDGLVLPEQAVLDDAELSDNALFHVTKVTRDSDTKATVTMELVKDGEGHHGTFTTFKELLDAVTAVPDTLSFTIPTITVTDGAAADTNLTLTGTVKGTFTGRAYDATDASARLYDLSWQGEQTPEGRDWTRPESDKSITLTVNAPTTDVPVTKVWTPFNTALAGEPGPVTIQLRSQAGEAKAADVPGKTLTISAKDSWKDTFKGLNAYTPAGEQITYSVAEKQVPTGYTSEVTGDATKGFTVTNTLGETRVNVTKKWVGTDPASAPQITVHLLADGQDTGQSRTVSADTGWQAVFSSLPATKADGETVIDYTVSEDAVEGYTGTVKADADGTFVITNTKDDEPVPTPSTDSEPAPTPTTDQQVTSATSQPTDSGKKHLPRTGAAVLGTGLAASALLAAGALLLAARRRS